MAVHPSACLEAIDRALEASGIDPREPWDAATLADAGLIVVPASAVIEAGRFLVAEFRRVVSLPAFATIVELATARAEEAGRS